MRHFKLVLFALVLVLLVSVAGQIIWGDGITWGTMSSGDQILWGTMSSGDSIVWGT
jgi:hypothetical protein